MVFKTWAKFLFFLFARRLKSQIFIFSGFFSGKPPIKKADYEFSAFSVLIIN